MKKLKFIIEDQRQAKLYNQIWDKIKELINSVDDVNFGFNDYFKDLGVFLNLILMILCHDNRY